MADEEITSLITINDGDTAEAKPLRQNFKYLDDRITAQSTNIANKESISKKGAANGYCPLDNTGKVPVSYLTLILGVIYSVGSLYITTSDGDTCPIASLISGSTWEKVGKGRVLQGADEEHEAGTTIAAGLPNITGTWSPKGYRFASDTITTISGAFSKSSSSGDRANYGGTGDACAMKFSAAGSNSIYGNSTTVQPPAYVVNIWRRTA